MSFPHYINFIRAVMPDAEWEPHGDVPMAVLPSGERFLVGPLSAWDYIRHVNADDPFPAPIVPLLWSDAPPGSPVPKGKWLLARLDGIHRMNGDIVGELAIPMGKFRPLPCGGECEECRMSRDFGPGYGITSGSL
jgi:hypothetical protein